MKLIEKYPAVDVYHPWWVPGEVTVYNTSPYICVYVMGRSYKKKREKEIENEMRRLKIPFKEK